MYVTYTFPHPLPFNQLYFRMERGCGPSRLASYNFVQVPGRWLARGRALDLRRICPLGAGPMRRKRVPPNSAGGPLLRHLNLRKDHVFKPHLQRASKTDLQGSVSKHSDCHTQLGLERTGLDHQQPPTVAGRGVHSQGATTWVHLERSLAEGLPHWEWKQTHLL